MAEACVLLLDTATPTLMAGLAIDGELRATIREESTSQRYHSAVLAARLQALLQQAGVSPHDLTALAVNIGPGRFTGLRTGLATARVMGQFLPVSCYAVTAFDLLLASEPFGTPVAMALDALQGRAYTAIRADTGAWVQPPALVSLDAWAPTLSANARVLASASLMPRFEGRSNAQSVESRALFTPGAMLALLAHGATPVTWEALLPLYLQAPSITPGKAAR